MLPEWFYRSQTQTMAILRPMIRAKVLKVRIVGLGNLDMGINSGEA